MITEEQLNKLISDHGEELYKYCFARLMGNKTETDDTVSDVWSIIVEKKDSLDNENMRTYIFKVADNCLRRHIRKLARQSRYELPLEVLDDAKDGAGQTRDNYFIDASRLEEYVRQIEDALPPEMKELFRMRCVKGMTIKDISKETGIPFSTVRGRIERIKETALKILGIE